MSKVGRPMDLLKLRPYDSLSFSLSARSVYTNIFPRLRNTGYKHKQINDDIYCNTVTDTYSLGRH